MGICGSLGPGFAVMADGQLHDVEVQQQLFLDELRNLYKFKVLVLGAGESGKSTVIKQLRFIHKSNKLTERELKRVKETLAENTFECFKALVDAAKNFGIELDDSEDRTTAEFCSSETADKTVLTPEMARALTKLWNSAAIKKTYESRDKFWILDAVEYFMENISRFAEPDFQPLEEDVVMARVRTTGIVTTEFTQRYPDGKEEWEKEIQYQVIDVGGQRAERKKWFHCFDDVKAILFVINLAGYNMVLFEEDTKNRMIEELELFRDTVRKDIFRRTPIFLFLNKKDMFEEKIRKVDLKTVFPEYDGGANTQKALEFISQKFREQMPPENLDQYRDFYIASRVKRDVRYAFEDLQNDLLRMYKKKLEAETKRILQEAKFSKR
jgi:GTPase SAR1 family protein